MQTAKAARRSRVRSPIYAKNLRCAPPALPVPDSGAGRASGTHSYRNANNRDRRSRLNR
jgi:hypothetical protein